MSFPPPTDQQARVLWTALTALAVAVLFALIGLLFWALGQLIHALSAVLLPLAVAGIVAYLLDPIVDALERGNMPRTRAITLVYLLGSLLVLLVLSTLVPRLIFEIGSSFANRFRIQCLHWNLPWRTNHHLTRWQHLLFDHASYNRLVHIEAFRGLL